MRRIVLVLACLALAGCGEGSDDTSFSFPDTEQTTTVDPAQHNAEVVEQAKSEETSAAAIWRRLRRELVLYDEADISLYHVYQVHGMECTIDRVEKVDAYSAAGPNDLLSPDGQWDVNVNTVVDGNTMKETPLSLCLQTAKNAMGW